MSTDPLAPAGDSAPTRTGMATRIAILVCAALVIAASLIPWFLKPAERSQSRGHAGLTFSSASAARANQGALQLGGRLRPFWLESVRPGMVGAVSDDGPAWRAGILADLDVVESIDGVPIADRAGLEQLAASVRPGDTIVYRVIRDSMVWVSIDPDSFMAAGGLAPADSVDGRRSDVRSSGPYTQIREHFPVSRDVRVRLDSASQAGGRWLEWGGRLLAGAVFLALGLLVFARRPGDSTALIFFALSSGAAAVSLSSSGWERWRFTMQQGLIPDAEPLLVLQMTWFVSASAYLLFLVPLLHFTLVFPKERPFLAQWPDSLRWLYVLAARAMFPLAPVMFVLMSAAGGGSPGIQAWAWAIGLGAGIVAILAVIAATRVGPVPAGRSRLLTRPGLTGLILAVITAAGLTGFGATVTSGQITSVGARISLAVTWVLWLADSAGGLALLLICTLAPIECLTRSHREGGVEAKRQIRWPLWGLTMGLFTPQAIGIIYALFRGLFRWIDEQGTTVALILRAVSTSTGALSMLLIAAGFAIAILKYRLMEIDVVIRRTVVYAALTGLLVAVYAVLVGGVGSIVGQAANTHSHWPTAFGTMAVAMVFFPARNRIQSLVDRRFFRTRFVATEALQRMSAVVSTTTQVPALMHAAVEEAQQALQSRTAAGFTFQPESHALAVVETIGLPDERRRELRLVLDEAAIGTLRSGTQLDSRALTGGLAALARIAGAELLVPIMHRGELRGLLTVGTKLSDQQIEPADREFLAAVAAQTGAGLANVESGARQRELEEARVIQAGLLPAELPALPGFDVAAYWQPAREVAGDLYDVFPVGERFALCIADVTGKGMPAALLMSSLQATLRGAAALGLAPVPLIERVNRTMSTQMAAGRFATLFYGELDPARRVLRYVNAGHNPPMLLRADGTCETLEIGGLLVGVFPEARYDEGEVTLCAGDRLLLYTDGITEAQNAAGDMFEEERLERELRGVPDGDAAAIQRRIIAATGEFCGGEWQDDATLVVLLTR